MSTRKYILTADDYGPVDFINDGIIHHVQKGNINSVHVLSNINQNLLNKNIDKLWKAVPQGKTVDIGLHLTLASGLPLIKDREGMNTPSIWGNFVVLKSYYDKKGQKVKNYVFSNYKDFYLEYELLDFKSKNNIEQTIFQEFKAQKDQLQTSLAVTEQNNPDKPNALKFTCISNHFDLFTLSDKFFTLYRAVVGSDLAIRSPRRIPLSKSIGYLAALGFFGVGTKNQIITAKRNIMLFDKYKYINHITLKTTGYTDVGLYASVGGFFEITTISNFSNRYKKLKEIVARSKSDKVWKNHPEEIKIVEIIFHLGSTVDKNPSFSKKDEQGYVSINYKYFDNRLIETRVLNTISQEKEFQKEVLNNLNSWETCPSINFTVPTHK